MPKESPATTSNDISSKAIKLEFEYFTDTFLNLIEKPTAFTDTLPDLTLGVLVKNSSILRCEAEDR